MRHIDAQTHRCIDACECDCDVIDAPPLACTASVTRFQATVCSSVHMPSVVASVGC